MLTEHTPSSKYSRSTQRQYTSSLPQVFPLNAPFVILLACFCSSLVTGTDGTRLNVSEFAKFVMRRPSVRGMLSLLSHDERELRVFAAEAVRRKRGSGGRPECCADPLISFCASASLPPVNTALGSSNVSRRLGSEGARANRKPAMYLHVQFCWRHFSQDSASPILLILTRRKCRVENQE